MKHSLSLLAALLTILPFTGFADGTDTKSLTFSEYPSYFPSDRPFTPTTSFVLKFNSAVDPANVERHVQFYDKNRQLKQPITASTPSEEEVRAHYSTEEELPPLDHFALIKPATPLAVGATWYLHCSTGLESKDGTHRVTEGQLEYLTRLSQFEIDEVVAANPYDESKRIVIRHSKRSLHDEVTESVLAQHISVSPTPKNLTFKPSRYSIEIHVWDRAA